MLYCYYCSIMVLITANLPHTKNYFGHLGETVRSLCQEVLELFKTLVGHEVFSHAYSKVKQGALQNREKRKVQSAFEVYSLYVILVL